MVETGRTVTAPAQLTFETGAIITGLVNETVFTNVVIHFVLKVVFVCGFVTAINTGVETNDGEFVAAIEGGVVRETTDLIDPLTNVDIFEESKLRTLFEISGGAEEISAFVSSFDDDVDDDDADDKDDEDNDDIVDVFSSLSTFTRGHEAVLAAIVVAVVDLDVGVVVAVVAAAGIILFPDFTDFKGLIFMQTPRTGAAAFFTDAGTCFKLAFVGSQPDVTGLKVALICLSLGVVTLGEAKHCFCSGMRSFFPSSVLSAEAGIFPKLLRFVGPWRDSVIM